MANVRLVAHVAKRYNDRGVSSADLVQEGFCGLLSAIDRFDTMNQTRLATYAIWWIRQAIQRAVAAGAYPVRLNPKQLHQLAQGQHHGRPRLSGIERAGRTRGQSRLLAGDRAIAHGHASHDLTRCPLWGRRNDVAAGLPHESAQ